VIGLVIHLHRHLLDGLLGFRANPGVVFQSSRDRRSRNIQLPGDVVDGGFQLGKSGYLVDVHVPEGYLRNRLRNIHVIFYSVSLRWKIAKRRLNSRKRMKRFDFKKKARITLTK
jgi:hypothetical protein